MSEDEESLPAFCILKRGSKLALPVRQIRSVRYVRKYFVNIYMNLGVIGGEIGHHQSYKRRLILTFPLNTKTRKHKKPRTP